MHERCTRIEPYLPAKSVLGCVVLLGVTSLLTIGMLLYYLLFQPRIPDSITRYTSRDAPFYDRDVCPGETFAYTIQTDILRGNATVMVVTTVWDVDRQNTILADDTPRYTVYEQPTHVARATTFTIPNLPPGRYERRHASQQVGGQAAVLVIPFRIKDTCPTIGPTLTPWR
jgi:hypothetical protein